MIDVIRQQLNKEVSDSARLNRLRECLQLIALGILHEKKYFDRMAFVGGTALRVLFDLRRFSEDLDFLSTDGQPLDADLLAREMEKAFYLNGLVMGAKVKNVGAVRSVMMRFEGVLKQVGLSPMASQKISIKLDVDTNPPHGGNVVLRPVDRLVFFQIAHYDLPSLFAGKLHACLFRKYVKGRDYYDLLWYLLRREKPNFNLLNNAVRQTQGVDPGIAQENFKALLQERLRNIDFDLVRRDVQPFIEDPVELGLLEREPLLRALENY